MKLSLIVPTYNERANVEMLLDRISRAVEGIPHEIVFVDDSTDGTDAVISAFTDRYPQLRLIHRTGRQGLASAVVEGFHAAGGDVFCVLDADLQHPPEVIPLLLDALRETDADLVIASRCVQGGSYGALPARRRLVSMFAALLSRMLLSRARLISDPMSGFFAFKRRAVQDVALQPLGYKVLLEILVRGRLNRVVEVPYRFYARGDGQSKLSMTQNWEFLAHLRRLVGAHHEDLRFLRFGLVGASGLLVNMFVFWLGTRGGRHYVYSAVAAVAAATTWNFLWNDAFTWRDRRAAAMATKFKQYFQYWAATGFGAAIYLACLVLLSSARVPHLLANLLGILAGAGVNFRANDRWTWFPARPSLTRVQYKMSQPSRMVSGHPVDS